LDGSGYGFEVLEGQKVNTFAESSIVPRYDTW
jgi:hypothetical protein